MSAALILAVAWIGNAGRESDAPHRARAVSRRIAPVDQAFAQSRSRERRAEIDSLRRSAHASFGNTSQGEAAGHTTPTSASDSVRPESLEPSDLIAWALGSPRGLSPAAPDEAASRSRCASTEPERCDGLDNDCDGAIDEAGAHGCRIVHFDDDGDGFGASAAGCFCTLPDRVVSNALDCDDARADVHPKAREVCDGWVDNDCDGYTDLCDATSHVELTPGDVVVRRARERAPGMEDAQAEWFELENRTARRIELMGLEVRDDGFDRFRIRRSLVLEPGGRAILSRSGDPATNGGISPDYVYSDFVLSNAGDSIELRSDGVVLDRVVYASSGDLVPDPSR